MDPKMADTAFEEMKRSLIDRYRETLIGRLTPRDLAELQSDIRNQDDPVKGGDAGHRVKREEKLRHYLHEEIIRREISSIEAVVQWLTPEDLSA